MKHIVSFSGGKDSTAMLLLMLKNNWPVDDIVFFDTGWEFPEMYKHIEKIEKYINRKITRLYPNKSFDYYFYSYKKEKGNNIGKSYSWPDWNNRWCTRMKINAVNKYVNSFGNPVVYEGLALDESHRFNPDKIYPLVKFGYTEKMALNFCYDLGFDWGGLYNLFSRVSCFCCPLKSIQELRALYNYKPELWKTMEKMDQDTWRSFRNDYTLKQLTRKFKMENKQLKIQF